MVLSVLKNWAWALVVVAVMLALAGTALVYRKAQRIQALGDPEQARRQGRPIPVRTVQVREGEVEQVIGATAVTAPSETASIRIGF